MLSPLQKVFTDTLSPVKFMSPQESVVAVPEKTPVFGSMATEEKSTQPIFSPQALPDKIPLLFKTPPLVGVRFTHPTFSTQKLPLILLSKTRTSPSVGLKFTHPSWSPQAHFFTESMFSAKEKEKERKKKARASSSMLNSFLICINLF
jgi:hypothetical protein